MAIKTGTTPILGSLPRDANMIAAQVGSGFQTADATGTPQVSPLTVSSSVITIVVPNKAVEFIAYPILASMRISELSGMTQYDVVLVGTKEVIDCANLNNIYVKRDAAVDVTLNFRFTMTS